MPDNMAEAGGPLTMTASEPPPGWQGKFRSRAEVLKVWPQAVWMPWDEPPVGTRVRFVDELDRVGKILGRYVEEPRPLPHCPTCTCTSANPAPSVYLGFWEIEVEGWYAKGQGFERTDMPGPDAAPLIELKPATALLSA